MGLAVGLARGSMGVVGSAQHLSPVSQAIVLAPAPWNLPGPSPAGPHWLGSWGEKGLEPLLGPCWLCQPSSQAAVGGEGRQVAWWPGWCWRVHGPSLTGLTFTGLGPHRGGAGVLSPSAEQAGAGPQKRGDKSMSVSPSAPVTLCSSHPRAALHFSHTL